jgi:hypothetical protein
MKRSYLGTKWCTNGENPYPCERIGSEDRPFRQNGVKMETKVFLVSPFCLNEEPFKRE